jgi:predicted adenylyl cyclase CyaB
MARNVEIKARVRDLAGFYARAQKIANDGPVDMVQDDTFFNCPNGRLKLRVFSPSKGELIFYKRADSREPKESQYLITPTSSPAQLRETLAQALGECGQVRKKRAVFHLGNTRIHLDEVEGLGAFMELEVVLSEGETVAEGTAVARRVMDALGIHDADLVEKAYVDLLNTSTGNTT